MSPKDPNSPPESDAQEWAETLYAPDRIEKWLKGEISLQELSAFSGADMLEMAVLGYSMVEQGKFEDAKKVFQGLATLDPKEGYYRTALGVVYLSQEDLGTAEQCFNDAIALNDKELASYVNRGEVYLRQGKVLEAAQDFKRAVDLDPQNKDPLSQRARILASAALETLEAAQRQAQEVTRGGTAPVAAPKPGPAAKPAAAKPPAGPKKK